MRRLFFLSLLLMAALVSGCGQSGATKPSASNPKGYLQTDPVDKKGFESAVLGRTTREITELLGPPKEVLNERTLGWVYSVPNTSSVILLFRDDKVVEVDW